MKFAASVLVENTKQIETNKHKTYGFLSSHAVHHAKRNNEWPCKNDLVLILLCYWRFLLNLNVPQQVRTPIQFCCHILPKVPRVFYNKSSHGFRFPRVEWSPAQSPIIWYIVEDTHSRRFYCLEVKHWILGPIHKILEEEGGHGCWNGWWSWQSASFLAKIVDDLRIFPNCS